jgi:hypothetical protein
MLCLQIKKMVSSKVFIGVGICFLVIGAFFILTAGDVITANAIRTTFSKTTMSFTGIICVIVALILLGTGARTEKKTGLEIMLINSGSKKEKTENPDRDYSLIESTNEFGQRGKPLSLGEFRRYVHSLGDPELVRYLNETYGPVFKEKALYGTDTEKKVGRAFYEALTGERVEEQEEDTGIGQKERERIKNAFRGYDGTVTAEMRSVLDEHDLSIKHGGKHYAILDGNTRIGTLPASPSDHRGGINFAHQLIRALETSKRKKSK